MRGAAIFLASGCGTAADARKINVLPMIIGGSVTHVIGRNCYPCARTFRIWEVRRLSRSLMLGKAGLLPMVMLRHRR